MMMYEGFAVSEKGYQHILNHTVCQDSTQYLQDADCVVATVADGHGSKQYFRSDPHRKHVIRKEAIEAVKEARAQGDLSENFEYHAAKKYKNQNESRIRYLERMLKNAEIVSDTSEEGVAGINNRVTVYFPEDDEEETYKLVTSIRGNSIHNYISTESPIGKAIFGHKAGETVKVKVSDDYSYELVIRKIEDTTDDEEDKIRAF